MSVHTPAEHTSPVAHARPHIPQCALVLWSGVSHPLAAFMSQSAKPTAQVIRHAPPMHVALALAPAVHAWLQRPQCVPEEVRSVSQPLAAVMSQSPKPVLHAATPHVPLAHEAVPLGAVQTRPHMPQFAGLSDVRRHCPEQHDSPVGHACRSLQPGTQFCVVEQICPAGHWSSAMHPTHTCWVVSQ